MPDDPYFTPDVEKPATKRRAPTTYEPDAALDLIAHHESNGRNIKQQIVPAKGGYNPSVGRVTGPSTAQGPWMITNSTWRKRGPREITQKYPTAMSAPVEVQREVARKIYQETGFQDWAPYNAGLRKAISRGDQVAGQADPYFTPATSSRTVEQKPVQRQTPKRTFQGRGTIGEGVQSASVTAEAPRQRGIGGAQVRGESRLSEGETAKRAMRNLGGIPVPGAAADWVNELAAKGASGLMQTGAGALKFMTSAPARDALNKELNVPQTDVASTVRRGLREGAGELGQGAQAMAQESGRGIISQTALDVGGGAVATAPALVLQKLGVPAPIAFGLDAYLKAEGRDAEFAEVLKETGIGAATGALFSIPVSQRLGLLKQIGARMGIVGGGTYALDKIAGMPEDEARKNAAVNALFAASGARPRTRPALAEAVPASKPREFAPRVPTPRTGEAAVDTPVDIEGANAKIDSIYGRMAEVAQIKSPTGRAQGLQRRLETQLADALRERNQLLDPKVQAQMEGRPVAEVLAERRANEGRMGIAEEGIPRTPVAEPAEVPTHARQNRRVRNVASGTKGQFKTGFKEDVEAPQGSPAPESLPAKPATELPQTPPPTEAASPAATRQYPLADRGEWYSNADYQPRGGRMVEMTPDEFSSKAKPLELDEVARDNIDDLKRHIESGRTLDPAALYPDGKTDGRHRAIAAKELGINKIPVIDFRLAAANPAIQLKPRQGRRSFPESVKGAGYEAESSNFDVKPNVDTVAKADATIKAKGLDEAVSELTSRREGQEFTPEDVVVGIRAIQKHSAAGDIQKSIDVTEILAEKLQKAGQTVQAASMIARLSPEQTLLYAQRQLPKGVKLKPEQGEKLVSSSKRVVQHEATVESLSAKIEQMGTAPKRVGTLEDRLLKMETDARARLAARVESGGVKGSQAGASTIPLDIADYAIIGAAKLARKGANLAQWTNEMVKEFGEGIRPHLKAIYRDSFKLYDDQRKQFGQEREVRGAMKAQPNAKDIQAVINERALARKDARTARSELRKLYADLSLTPFGKAKAVAGDVLNVPRTLKSSVDLSAPRQAAMWMINHPAQAAKVFFGKQLKAMREVNYDRYVDQLEADPDFPLMTRSKLALTTTDARPHSLTGREEAFMSRLAGKVPLVKHSERAYTTFLDTARASWFKQLKTQAENAAKAKGTQVTPEQYTAIADFVNIATGRGNLGHGTVNKISPFLNAVFFAPKFAASKVQIFDPRRYSRLPPGARRTAMREAATYFGAMTTAALLLKVGLGARVGTDPEEADFMKVRAGNTRYDLANGTGQYVTLAARLLRNAENKRTGQKDKFGKSFMENLDRFARYKYSPPTAAVRNLWEGKNAIGEPTDLKTEGLGLIEPLFVKDMREAFQEEGLMGAAKTSPAFVGVGVNTYGDRPPKRRTVDSGPRTAPKRRVVAQ